VSEVNLWHKNQINFSARYAMLYVSSIMPIERNNLISIGLGVISSFTKNHPKDMGEKEVQEFLKYLASERKVSAST